MALIVLLFSLIFFFPVGLEGATKSPKADTNTGVHRTPNAGYRLGANDVIRVQVFGEDDLSTETRVSGDGKINPSLARYFRNQRIVGERNRGVDRAATF